MEQGYKHFRHSHNLVMHQLPEGVVDVSCSGCHSSCKGTVFVCWQCNFFLHDQCYRATRSLKHPSHPPHPLTFLPYPTSPSNSFYCNSCEFIGTGFSYSCAHCDFDLHVQCAHSISRPTCSFQELAPPSWNSVPDNLQHPLTAAQNLYMDPNAHRNTIHSGHEYHSTGHENSDTNAQNPSIIQDGHSLSIPGNIPPYPVVTSVQYPFMAQAGPSVSIPTSPQYPTLGLASVSIPTNNPNDQNFNMAQNLASVSIPAASPDYHPENRAESGQNQVNQKGIMHFSHPHSLCMVNLQDEENKVACSGCEKTLHGKGYSCGVPVCNFHLHESYFHLKREIQHKSHPQHPLTLLSSAPYNNKNGEFTCNACFSDGTGFTYHCSVCKFDLHIECASLPDTVKRSDHEHMLKLYYYCPLKSEEYIFVCDVCHVSVQKDGWSYYCESCDYGTHLGCVDREECVVDNTVLDTQMQLQSLQLQMQMSRQQTQMFASMGTGVLY